MRELDWLLLQFVDSSFDSLTDSEKARFAEILDFPDPDLYAYLLGKAAPTDPDLVPLLQRIRESVSIQG